MKIALVGRDADRVLAFRGSLARLARREGHDVIAITRPASDTVRTRLASEGIRLFGVPLDGGGLNPLADLAYRRRVTDLLRHERVDAVLAYNPKCLAHATVAARRAGVRRVVGMVTGLGHGFIGRGLRERLVRLAKARLYRRAFRACDRVLVQNPDDLEDLRRCGALDASAERRVRLVAGSGVDLEAFTPSPLPDGAHFLMIARPLREKGLPEFLQAASRVKRMHPSCTFTWMGPTEDTNPSALGRAELEHLLASSAVRHLPECPDVRPVIEACSVFVLPSHREGTSKVMLEAMAMGRPLITTDAPGCGHLVAEGRAGKTIPAGDAVALAETMAWCATHADWRRQAATCARAEAERRFDARVVDRIVLDAVTGSAEPGA